MIEAQSIKIHLGCGTKKLEGWVNIDSVVACKPDLIHDISQPLPYDDCCADEILAEDLLEHFDKYARYVVFYVFWVCFLKSCAGDSSFFFAHLDPIFPILLLGPLGPGQTVWPRLPTVGCRQE